MTLRLERHQYRTNIVYYNDANTWFCEIWVQNQESRTKSISSAVTRQQWRKWIESWQSQWFHGSRNFCHIVQLYDSWLICQIGWTWAKRQHPLQQVHERDRWQGSHHCLTEHQSPTRWRRRYRSRWSASSLAPPTSSIPQRRCHDIGWDIMKSVTSYGKDIG